MRYYTMMSIIGMNPGEDVSIFQDRVANRIDEYQVDNCGAEVQFQANGAQCVALVLQYKEN